VIWFALATAASASSLAPGETVPDAVAVQLSEDGLNGLGELVPALLPSPTVIDDTSDAIDLWICDLSYWLENLWVGMELQEATITPNYGTLTLEAEIDVWINDSSDKARIGLDLCGATTDCGLYVDPFPVYVTMDMALGVVEVDGVSTIDVTLGSFDVDYDLAGNDLNIDGCWVEYLELLYDVIIGLADGAIQGAISSLAGDLEQQLEDAFSQLAISEQVEVTDGVVLDIELYPGDLDLTPEGMELVLSGSASAEASECIAAWDPGVSEAVDSDRPALDPNREVLALVSDEFTNQLLYAAWRSGLLCYELAEFDALSLDSSILSLLVGDAFDDLFPDTVPILIQTMPKAPPTGAFDMGDDVTLDVKELGLNIFAEVDGRMAKTLGLSLDAEVGMDLDFDGTTGELGMALDIDPDRMVATVTDNELAAGTDAQIEDNFGSFIEGTVLPLVDTLLGDALAFALPGFEGVGLTSLQLSAEGGGDWLGAEAALGAVPYEGGCSDKKGKDGGCGGGCSGGCATSEGRMRTTLLILFPLGLALLRRRR